MSVVEFELCSVDCDLVAWHFVDSAALLGRKLLCHFVEFLGVLVSRLLAVFLFGFKLDAPYIVITDSKRGLGVINARLFQSVLDWVHLFLQEHFHKSFLDAIGKLLAFLKLFLCVSLLRPF